MAEVKDYSAEALLNKEKEVELDTDNVKEESIDVKEETVEEKEPNLNLKKKNQTLQNQEKIIKKELISLSFKKKKQKEEKKLLLNMHKVYKRNLTPILKS
mgnify:CR=1 FL=1